MPVDPLRLAAIVEQVIGQQPHPDAPSLSVSDFMAHREVAAMMKGEEGATADDVVQAYHLLRQIDMSPAEFEHTWQLAQPTATRLLDRDPLPQEVKMLHGALPGDVHDYYANHPYPGFEENKAIDMARYFHAAKPIANHVSGRDPLPNEVARFAAAGYDADAIHRHYTHQGKS
jgi:hypothetical protein